MLLVQSEAKDKDGWPLGGVVSTLMRAESMSPGAYIVVGRRRTVAQLHPSSRLWRCTRRSASSPTVWKVAHARSRRSPPHTVATCAKRNDPRGLSPAQPPVSRESGTAILFLPLLVPLLTAVAAAAARQQPAAILGVDPAAAPIEVTPSSRAPSCRSCGSCGG